MNEKEFKLAICIPATKSYSYALSAQCRRIQAAVSHIDKGHIILVGDKNQKLADAHELYKKLLPDWNHIYIDKFEGIDDSHKNYTNEAQLVISQLQTEAFSIARTLKADQVWSVESDVLPAPNSLKCSQWALEFDDGYYSVALSTYNSQGMGDFMGGRGTPQQNILPDWYEDEREIPEKLRKELKETRGFLQRKPEEMKAEDPKKIESAVKKLHELEKEVREKCNPKHKTIWKANAIQWRRRGWLSQAYPAIGKGAILPTDWVGWGCTQLNQKALNWILFDGYDGSGTSDLYICWRRWHQSGLRACVLTHCPADHVVRDKNNPNKYIQCQAYFETEGECVNHLRMRPVPFYSHDIGEKYDIKNDGKMTPEPPSKLEPNNVKAH